MFKTDASQRWLLYFIVVTILALYQSYFIIGLVPVLFYAWKSPGYKIWHTKTDVSLVIIFIFETVSIFFSEYKYNTIFESSKICAGLLFYLCIRHFLKYKNAELILSFTLISSLVSLLSILSFLNSRNILLGVGLRNINQFKNLFHPLGQFCNEFVTVELGFVCLLLLFFKNIVYVPNKWPMKIGILLSLTLAIVNVLVSFSRGAYLALSILVIWIVVHFIFVRQIRKSFKYLFLTFVLASLATVPIFKYIVDSASIHGSVSQTRSVEGRLNIWSDALKISKVKPIIGIGAGNFALKYNSTRSCNATSIFTSRIANTPLQIYVERGIIGLVLYLFVYYYILAAFRKYPGYNTNDRDILLTALGGYFVSLSETSVLLIY